MLDYWYPIQVLLDITGQYNHLTTLQSILVFLCLNRLDFRPPRVWCSLPEKNGWKRERQSVSLT